MNYRNMSLEALEALRNEARDDANKAAAAGETRSESAAADRLELLEGFIAERRKDERFTSAYAASGFAPAGTGVTEARQLSEALPSLRRGEVIEARAALATGVSVATGSATVPEEVSSQVITPALYVAGVVGLVRNITTASGEKMNLPRLATRSAFAPVAELGTYAQSDPTFENVILDPVKFGALAAVSTEFLADSAIDAGGEVVRQFQDSWRSSWESQIVLGTNVTAGLVATTTSKTVAGIAAVTADELIEAAHDLNAVDRASAVWMFEGSTIEAIRKLKGSDGQYLLSGLSEGTPTLLGRPVLEVPSLSAMGTGNTFGLFGNLRQAYASRVVRDMTVSYSDEFRFDEDLRVFKATVRADGNLQDPTAVLKLVNA